MAIIIVSVELNTAISIAYASLSSRCCLDKIPTVPVGVDNMTQSLTQVQM